MIDIVRDTVREGLDLSAVLEAYELSFIARRGTSSTAC